MIKQLKEVTILKKKYEERMPVFQVAYQELQKLATEISLEKNPQTALFLKKRYSHLHNQFMLERQLLMGLESQIKHKLTTPELSWIKTLDENFIKIIAILGTTLVALTFIYKIL